jgi:hypothetical protein
MLASTILALSSRGSSKPCDIYDAAGTPCVAAHSVVRTLYHSFDAALYTVQRSSDNKTLAVMPSAATGIADTSKIAAFCAGNDVAETCFISTIWDQSPKKNHLTTSPPGGAWHHPCRGVNATREPFTIAGTSVYAAYFEGDMGYRNDVTSGVATGD